MQGVATRTILDKACTIGGSSWYSKTAKFSGHNEIEGKADVWIESHDRHGDQEIVCLTDEELGVLFALWERARREAAQQGAQTHSQGRGNDSGNEDARAIAG